jgi:hypothetical protein
MAEQQCPTCHEQGMENPLSMSHAQKLHESPWFYSVYCKVCGHVDGVFAQDVFTITAHRVHSARKGGVLQNTISYLTSV